MSSEQYHEGLNTGLDQRSPSEAGRSRDLLGQLCAVVRRPGFGRTGRYFFIGWTESDKPYATDKLSELMMEARRNFDWYQRANLEIPSIEANIIYPIEYQSADEPINFEDQGPKRAKDLLRYYARDVDNHLEKVAYLDEPSGLKEISIDELTILASIAARREPWQDATGLTTGDATKVKKMYTIFLPVEDQPSATIALLFKPPIAGMSNEATLNRFMVDTITKLLTLEREGGDKGYLRAVQNFFEKAFQTGEEPSAGVYDILILLRDLGFINLDSQWFRTLAEKNGFLARTAFVLESAALKAGYLTRGPNVSPSLRDFIKYQQQINNLDLSTLFSLSESLARTARRTFSR